MIASEAIITIYEKILSLKNLTKESVLTLLFFHTRFKNLSKLQDEFMQCIEIIDSRIVDLKLYNQSI
mgnify:CR=1 FL=1